MLRAGTVSEWAIRAIISTTGFGVERFEVSVVLQPADEICVGSGA
jgi:hypothetical protein